MDLILISHFYQSVGGDVGNCQVTRIQLKTPKAICDFLDSDQL
jgi:hypothetical protein